MGIVSNLLFLYILSASCIYLALWLVTCRLACFVIIITSDFRRSLGWLDVVVYVRIATSTDAMLHYGLVRCLLSLLFDLFLLFGASYSVQPLGTAVSVIIPDSSFFLQRFASPH